MTKATIKSRPTSHGSVYNGALASLLPFSGFFFLLSIRLVKYVNEFFSYFLKRERERVEKKETKKKGRKEMFQVPAPHHSFPSINTHWRGGGGDHLNNTALTKLIFRFPESLVFTTLVNLLTNLLKLTRGQAKRVHDYVQNYLYFLTGFKVPFIMSAVRTNLL